MDELLNRAINGDKEAYTELILSIKEDLFYSAFSRLKNVDDANDVIQETIINSFNKLHTLENPELFKAWINKILVNECIMLYRKRSRQLGIFDKLKTNFNIFKSEKDISEIESSIDFELLIDDLSDDDKLLITLYYDNRYSVSEISEILHMNINTVKSKIDRARDKLKDKYDKKRGLKK